MVHILNGGKAQGFNKYLEDLSIDDLHSRRRKHEEILGQGIFTKDQMNMTDCKNLDDEMNRLFAYEKWKAHIVDGMTNEDRMREWSDINREFKRRKEEGRQHTIDDIRNRKVKYD